MPPTRLDRQRVFVEEDSFEPRLHAQFAKELLKSERLRTSILAVFFGGAFLLSAGRTVLVQAFDIPAINRGTALFLVGFMAIYELLLWRFVTHRLKQNRSLPRTLLYGSTGLELGTFTAGVILIGLVVTAPLFLSLIMPVAVYFFFIILSTLRLNFVHSLFTGIVASVGYLFLVAFIPDAIVNDLDLPEPYPEARVALRLGVGPIFFGSVFAGLVARQIRQRTFSFLRAASERDRLEREVLEIATREQQRIGRDLHDGLGSYLTGVAMRCWALARRRGKGQPVEEQELEEVATMVEASVEQARRLSHGLNPVILDEEGLPAALRELALSTEALARLPCTLTMSEDLPTLTYKSAEHLYRIAQEAVTNAVKHAQAQHLSIALVVENGALILTVRDDGTGMSTLPAEKGMGLRTMARRARIINAELYVGAAPDGGTVVTCTMRKA